MTDERDLPRTPWSAGARADDPPGLSASGERSLAARTRELLARYDLRLRKSLGQNFLLNQAKVERIAGAALAAAEELGAETIVEVGPGLGALTLPLGRSGRQVVAFEIDQRLRPALDEVLAGLPNVSVRWEDFLHGDVTTATDGRPYVAAGNLPYQITAPLLEKLLGDPQCRALVITVQKEVAERLAAEPGGKDYGPLTLFCRYHVAALETIVRLSPGDFLPPPQVDSVALKLVKRTAPPFAEPDAAQFSRTVRAAFNHRRKSLVTGLTHAPQLGLPREQVAAAVAHAGLDGQRRAETLTMDELARLALAFQQVECA
ncbi:16S rRNA (adenine(1518)-N(6)/adenine(1519)-N(6))-dimethyltransferase RsmA [bacterium]|nr:16S rRNA (adenine(1518)-N(6)/adenine(1519)-N(6))-dimethyltransferase RsmA [bacterium]